MTWSDPTAAIGVKKPVRASTHLALFANFAGMANGDPGAPRIQIPQAVATTETDTSKVLQPNGSGGVQWGSVAGALAGGQHIDINGGTPTTTIPSGPLIYVLHGSVRNTAYHNIVLPAPSASVAGHIVLISIEQIGSFGGSRIRIGSAGGSLAAQWNDGDSHSSIWACDGSHWTAIFSRTISDDDD
jgi:hypothetical protein